MGKTFSSMKYRWSSTNFGSIQKICCLYLLQNFAYYFILIVFFSGPTVKPCSNLRFPIGDVFVKKQVQRGLIASTGPQLCKVESNNIKQHPMNQRASINQSTRNVGEEQYCQNLLQTRLYKIIRGIYCNTHIKQTFHAMRPDR